MQPHGTIPHPSPVAGNSLSSLRLCVHRVLLVGHLEGALESSSLGLDFTALSYEDFDARGAAGRAYFLYRLYHLHAAVVSHHHT